MIVQGQLEVRRGAKVDPRQQVVIRTVALSEVMLAAIVMSDCRPWSKRNFQRRLPTGAR